MIPYIPMIRPADAFLNFAIKSAAACLRPFRSKVPVKTRTMINVHMLRLDTKLDPNVCKNVTTSMPETSAVTMAATMMISMESNFKINPTTTIKIPSNFKISIKFLPPYYSLCEDFHKI